MAKRYKYIPWFFSVIFISIILLYIIDNSPIWEIQEGFDDLSSTYKFDYYVITMGQPKRIENIEKQTNTLNNLNPNKNNKIVLQIIDAVNGDDLNLPQLVKDGVLAKEVLTESSYRGFGEINKRKYELGCYLSHIRTYEKIQNGIKNGSIDPEGYSIIFEDDLEVQNDYFTGLKMGMDYLKQNNTDFDLLFLGVYSETNDKIGSNVFRPNCPNIYNCYYSHAYLIPNNKVDKIKEKMTFMDNTVDIKIFDLSEKKELIVYRIMPDIVNQNSPVTGSIIR